MNNYVVLIQEPESVLYAYATHVYVVVGDDRAFEEYEAYCRMASSTRGTRVELWEGGTLLSYISSRK